MKAIIWSGLFFNWCFFVAFGRPPELAVYDTGIGGAAAFSAEELVNKTGWVKLETKNNGARQGGVALVNHGMAMVLRPKANGADLYGIGTDGVKLRAHLTPLGAGENISLVSVKVVSVEDDSATVEAVYQNANGMTLSVTYSLGMANPILKTKSGMGVIGQCVEAPSRLGVLPDFFADDLLIDARSIPVDHTEIPGENFFMNMLDSGKAIVTTIWDKNKRDVELVIKGQADARVIAGVNVFYGDEGSIWVAVLEEQGIWSTSEVNSNNVKKVISLDWIPPWKAKWRGDFVRVDHTVDSWFFAAGPQLRKGWSGVVGGYENPCWFDAKTVTNAYIQPPVRFPNGNFDGPFVVYPLDRTSETPLDRMTITDAMRNSLGVGPCEYIMDVAGQGSSSKGIYTCSVEHSLPPLFALGQQKDERVFINMMCREVQVFVKAIQDRINEYVDFRAEILIYLAEQKKVHPEQAAFIARLEDQARRLQASKVNNIGPVAKMADQIKSEIMADVSKVDAGGLSEGIAGVGLGGDNMVARCRQTVKVLRQMATIEMAINPDAADVAKEMRKRTQQILRGALGHEMI